MLNSLRTFLFFSFVFSMAVLFVACAEEEPLTPNEEAGRSQTPNFDGSGFGTGGNNGNGGGNNGGANLPTEYFNYDVDGVTINSSDPYYQSGFGLTQIINSVQSPNDIVQIGFFSEPQDTTYANPSLTYIESSPSGKSYEAFNGEMVLDSVSAELIIGSFYCDVASTSGDTLSLTNASFLVHR
ncbi:MAG: hypothetical protein RIC95_08100 [Vicingaceae bacterium]